MSLIVKTQFNDQVESVIQMVVAETNSEKTAQVYEDEIRKFLAHSAGQGVQSPAQAVGAYKRSLRERGYKPATINKKLSAIRKFFRVAAREGLIPADLASKAESVESIPVRGQKRGNWLDAAGMRQLLNFPVEEGEDERLVVRDRAILAVFLACGLRVFEVAELVWGQFRKREMGGKIVAQFEDIQGKHHRVRTVPVASYAVALLETWHALRPAGDSERIFVSLTPSDEWNGQITTNGLWRVVKKRAGAAGLPQISVHDLRRSAATLLYNRTDDMKQAQFMLGHTSMAVTERYLDTSLDAPLVADAMEL